MHTPAPWKINKYEDCIHHGDSIIAEKPHGKDAWLDNARLIANAPVMKEALIEIVELANESMGEWAGIEPPYLPAVMLGYYSIAKIADALEIISNGEKNE